MDYKSTYLTDNEGKVLFPHSSIDEVFSGDGKNLRKSGVFHHEGEDIKDIEVVSTQSDWNENDENALGYIKNRPFYFSDYKSLENLKNKQYQFIFNSQDWFQDNNLSLEEIENLEDFIVTDYLKFSNYILKLKINNEEEILMITDMDGFEEEFYCTYNSEKLSITFFRGGDDIYAAGINGVEIFISKNYYTEGTQINIQDMIFEKINVNMDNIDQVFLTKKNNQHKENKTCGSRWFDNFTHAEGYNTFAGGTANHAEGANTISSGIYSHSEGCRTKSVGISQHVQGQYNIEDNSSAHIVGWGNYSTNKNIHTLSTQGTAWFQGDVYVGSTGGKNRDAGSKKLIAENTDAKVNTLQIGNTKITEAQLQALLALLN